MGGGRGPGDLPLRAVRRTGQAVSAYADASESPMAFAMCTLDSLPPSAFFSRSQNSFHRKHSFLRSPVLGREGGPTSDKEAAVIVALHVATGAAAGAASGSRLAALLLGPVLHLAGYRLPH